MKRDAAGRCELAPDAFLAAISEGIGSLLQEVPVSARDIRALSFASQTNSFLILDRRDDPLTPLILWPDLRAAAMEGFSEKAGMFASRVGQTGVPVVTHEFMVAKLLWLRRDRDIWSKVRRAALISDYLMWWLTGEWITEAGACGLTGLCDIRLLKWIPSACETVDLDTVHLPRITRAGTDLGVLLPARAAELGLPLSCHVVVGCLDQYAGALGVGNIRPGGCSETTGTVLSAVRCSDRMESKGTGVFQGPAWSPDGFYQMTFGSCSANLLEWYRGQLPDHPPFELLSALAAGIPAGAEGLRLSPNAGHGPIIEGFIGMTPAHGRGHCVRCIFEAVASALNDHIAALCGDMRPAEVRCAGGGARSDLWLKIKADHSGVPMIAMACSEPTSLGAAILAAHGTGWGTVDDLVLKWVHSRGVFRPGPNKGRM